MSKKEGTLWSQRRTLVGLICTYEKNNKMSAGVVVFESPEEEDVSLKVRDFFTGTEERVNLSDVKLFDCFQIHEKVRAKVFSESSYAKMLEEDRRDETHFRERW